MSACAKDGNLFILVLQAKHVSGHRKDAFCKIYVDKQRFFKTQTVDKTTDPKWEEQARQLSMSKDKSVTTLRFAIYHDRTFLWDSFLGEVSFNIDELSDGVPRDDWFPLKKKGGSEAQGELHLQLLFLEPGDTMSEKYDEFPYPLQTLMRKKRFTQFSKALTTLKPEYLEAKDRDGNRPLHVACLLDLPDCVTQLIDKGADPKGTDANGEVQIIHKAAGFCSKAITTLLDKGVDIKAKDKEGRAPIHHAAVENNVKSLTLLLEKGAEINAVDNEGHTALHRALLEKECADSIKFLVEKGIDIRLADKSGVACTQLCADRKVSDKMKKAFLRACGVIDEREFPIIPNLSKKRYIEGNHLAMEWKDNLQFAISTKPGVSKISVLMHYDFEDRTIKPMEKIGFLVIKTTQGTYREPSYQQDFIGYGTADPFEIKIDEDKKDSANFFCLMPYAKTPDVTGYFDMIVYADGEFELTELVAWKNSSSSAGEWSAQQSGGSQEFDTWLNNPKFTLTFPKGQEKIKACVLLSQQKAALDLIPYQVTPYQFYIGYYILDHELFDVKHQYPRWKNAQEIFLHIDFDTTKENEYVIIPTTHKSNELTSFTLTVFSDQEVKVEKK